MLLGAVRTAGELGAKGARRAHSVVTLPKFVAGEVPPNEPVLGYRKGSAERTALQEELARTAAAVEDVPIVIGDKEIRDGEIKYQVMPHNHGKKIAKFYYADEKIIREAIDTATKAQEKWERISLDERAAIFERAADLVAGPHRQKLNSATMLGQSKSAIQAEIDSAAELADFLRFNVHFLKQHAQYQPVSENANVTRNSMRFRGLEGFVAAVSPFNFTAIGGNLASAPALMGCSVLWKPSDTALLSNWRAFKILREAGLPPGVVNFVPSDGPVFGGAVTTSPHLAGINFTGSVPTFNWLWRAVANNLENYKNYPRLLGECGGKNYHFVHPSADMNTVVATTIRSAFEYCGQKCSACSRMYVPRAIWPHIRDGLLEERAKLKIGDVSDLSVFAGAVIDDKAFERITGYIKEAKNSNELTILGGGEFDKSSGYFVQPTIIQTKNPRAKIMREEIFGPVLTVYVYDDIELAMREVIDTTPFALTGAIFAKDEAWLRSAFDALRYSAGNFYINDKSTGAVVGQQPFGGARHSGTNDKAGGPPYLLRWTSPQAIKETFVPLPDVSYPYMKE